MDFLLALVLSVILWISCIYWGKFFFSKFKPNILQHFLCFIIMTGSCICFFTIFKLNKVHAKVKETETFIIAEINNQISNFQTNTKYKNKEELKSFTLGLLQKEIDKRHPMLSRFFTVNSPTAKNMESLEIDINDIARTVVSPVSNTVCNKIKSYRNKAIFTIIVLQFVTFGMATYCAHKSSKRAISVPYDFNRENYI